MTNTDMLMNASEIVMDASEGLMKNAVIVMNDLEALMKGCNTAMD